jgi:hypothetical protein
MKVFGNMIECGHCGLKGDRTQMRFCEKVPVFAAVPSDKLYDVKGQAYEDTNGQSWILPGYVPGCGRVMTGDYCNSCRSFIPYPVDKPRRNGKRSAREVDDGQRAASGDRI